MICINLLLFRFQLFSFNDYGREINRNVKLEVTILGDYYWVYVEHLHLCEQLTDL